MTILTRSRHLASPVRFTRTEASPRSINCSTCIGAGSSTSAPTSTSSTSTLASTSTSTSTSHSTLDVGAIAGGTIGGLVGLIVLILLLLLYMRRRRSGLIVITSPQVNEREMISWRHLLTEAPPKPTPPIELIQTVPSNGYEPQVRFSVSAVLLGMLMRRR